MRRSLVAVPLLLVLALTAGCGDDDKDKKDESKPSETTSTTTEPSEDSSTSPSTQPTEPVTSKQFCDDAKDALKGDSASQVLQQVATVVADGLPEDMPQDAVDGIQVLIDIAPQLEKTSTALKAYTDLSSEKRGKVNALATYLTTTCGQNLVADIIPALKDIPSELLSLLPSDLPTVMPSS
ncbi:MULTISPECIES: hypothetical protein [unclassified Nocardioides]|uniref:hypothetical protein n=1 Tax=unclassified Nocardioides TaxID=2615069 RepID=UPI0006FAF019|nr:MULTISPECIES: hypothetical protein [unclassified Nocardioides]KQY55431.1 hypothetical protein ASD30_16110 [Nocardioides sp. Root140]KRF14537.1 hypothetical protein ASH02_09435 [Nocardioides sp. Soil796]